MASGDADTRSGEASGIAHAHLRSALEFAVLMAAAGQKRKPAIPFPKELKPFLNKARLPAGSLGRIRRVIEADDVFRSRLAAGALPELVDAIGRLWLTRPDGWEAAASALAAELDEQAAESDRRAALRRAERRREAAEQAAIRTRAELLQLNEVIEAQGIELHELRAEVVKADEAVREMRTELVDVRVEIRHARDREAAAQARAQTAQRELDEARRTIDQLTSSAWQVDDAGSGEAPVAAAESPTIAPSHIAAAVDGARRLADDLAALLPSPSEPARGGGATSATSDTSDTAGTASDRRPARRTAMGLPGGVISTSREAAEFLVRSDAALLIDGYNVAKLGWPNRTLEQQRNNVLDAVENLARRFGTDVTVVFDGASIVGAHADRRRLARVVYSPAGVTADDVIRDEVARLPTSRHVVVATNDAAIVRDVRAAGANVVPSNALLAVL